MKYKLIAYSPSSKGEARLKQNYISGEYCVEFNDFKFFGKLSDVWPAFKLTKGVETRYIHSND